MINSELGYRELSVKIHNVGILYGKERKTRYRSRSDIVATILQSTAQYREGVGVTKMMYISFLSYLQADKYMRALRKFTSLVRRGPKKIQDNSERTSIPRDIQKNE